MKGKKTRKSMTDEQAYEKIEEVLNMLIECGNFGCDFPFDDEIKALIDIRDNYIR